MSPEKKHPPTDMLLQLLSQIEPGSFLVLDRGALSRVEYRVEQTGPITRYVFERLPYVPPPLSQPTQPLPSVVEQLGPVDLPDEPEPETEPPAGDPVAPKAAGFRCEICGRVTRTAWNLKLHSDYCARKAARRRPPRPDGQVYPPKDDLVPFDDEVLIAYGVARMQANDRAREEKINETLLHCEFCHGVCTSPAECGKRRRALTQHKKLAG